MTHEIKWATANIVLAIGGLNGFVSTEVQNSTFVLRLKFSAKSPAHRQYAARCRKFRKNANQTEFSITTHIRIAYIIAGSLMQTFEKKNRTFTKWTYF